LSVSTVQSPSMGSVYVSPSASLDDTRARV
jgi:hypothetical protein